MKAVLRLASLTSCPSLWLVTFLQDVDLIRQNAKIKVTVVYCNIRHWHICVTRIYKSIRTKQSAKQNENTAPTKLCYKGFEISDCVILVNDPEVTESCNNGQIVSISYAQL